MASFKGSFYMRQTFGVDQDPPEETRVNYSKALLVIAAGDSEISEAEWQWFEDAAYAAGALPEHIEQYRSFNYREANLEELLSGVLNVMTPMAIKRTLVYDGLRMAKADAQLAEGERAIALKAAKLLGIDNVTFLAIEGLVNMEYALKAARIALINAE